MSDFFEQSWAYWQSGGPLLISIAAVSFGLWAYFMQTRAQMLHWVRQSRKLEPEILHLDPQAGPAEVLNCLQAFRGGIAALIRMVMQDVNQGTKLTDAFARREHEGLMALRRDLIILSALTAVAPLLGLLGTVMGMIETFDAVSKVGGDTGSRVASGISRALITTQFGLIVALPGVFGVARLRRLLSHVEVRMTECRMLIVNLFERQQHKGGNAV